MLLGYLPTWAVYLTVYENTREYYFDQCGSWWLARCYSSLTAGACSTVLTNPIWVIKTRLMSQSTKSASDGMRAPWHYTSTLDAVRKMYRNEGIASFYSGLTPALLGLTHVAVQFPLYEFFKMKFTGYAMGDHPSDEGRSHWAGITAATFLSKVCASTATYPHEVLRTRLQTQQRQHPAASPEGITHSGSMREPIDIKKGITSSDGMAVTARYKGIMQTFKVILQEEGWRAFYAGIGTNLVRAVPAAMVTMITYEWLQSTIHHAQEEGEEKKKERDRLASASV
jgi:solute carrier family 25 (mitochondrial folate transporter), member 32